MRLPGGIKDIDTSGSAMVPGAVRVSSKDAVKAGPITATEGCR